MGKPKLLVTARIHDEVRQRLASHFDVENNPGVEPWPADELRMRTAQCDAMMVFMTDHIDEAFLAAAPQLKFIACALKGYDNIDVGAAARRGIGVSIVPDLLTAPTAELALGLAIALARKLREGDAMVRSGAFKGWRPTLYGRGLAGSRVAILGMGKVGKAIAQRLAGFESREIVGVDPQAAENGVKLAAPQEAVAQADFIFAGLPLTAGTRNFVNADLLACAQRVPLIINVGRGSTVDENAVVDALETGRIAGYGADVFAFEDWALPDRPREIPARLLAHPATLFTPHLGSAVADVRLAIEHHAAGDLIAWFSGQRTAGLLPSLP